KLEHEHEQWQRSHSIAVTAADREEILALGENLPKIWYAETTTHVDRKRITRLLIKDVLLDKTREKGKVWIQINWQTGTMSHIGSSLRFAVITIWNKLMVCGKELKN